MGLRILALLLLVLESASASALSESKLVLVLHSFRNALPINREFYAGISEGLHLPPDMPVEIDSDTLDLWRVNDEGYVRKLIEIYGLKFEAKRPSLIIPTYTAAAQFLLDHRRELFRRIPIAFCAAEFPSEDLKQLPPDVTGVTSKRDIAGTLELMSRLQTDMRQVAVIIGSSDLDASWEQDARKALPPLSPGSSLCGSAACRFPS
jgi:ABC-type uncharacterized transport system substrate-binding protein